MSALLTADELGRIYGRSGRQIRRWYADGAIPAAVNEGRTLRFDADEVAKALAKRAKAHRPVPKLPDGMVPTY